MNDYKNAIALIDEGLEVFTNLIDSVTRHGNYSAESTCTFIDQGAAAVREARALLSALAPVEPEPVAMDDAWDIATEALDDSMDMDWTTRRGARSVVNALKDAGLLASPVAPPSAEDDLVAAREAAAPCGIASPSYSDCPNMKEVGGGMAGERYWCAICSKGYFLDYEDMK